MCAENRRRPRMSSQIAKWTCSQAHKQRMLLVEIDCAMNAVINARSWHLRPKRRYRTESSMKYIKYHLYSSFVYKISIFIVKYGLYLTFYIHPNNDLGIEIQK